MILKTAKTSIVFHQFYFLLVTGETWEIVLLFFREARVKQCFFLGNRFVFFTVIRYRAPYEIPSSTRLGMPGRYNIKYYRLDGRRKLVGYITNDDDGRRTDAVTKTRLGDAFAVQQQMRETREKITSSSSSSSSVCAQVLEKRGRTIEIKCFCRNSDLFIFFFWRCIVYYIIYLPYIIC